MSRWIRINIADFDEQSSFAYLSLIRYSGMYPFVTMAWFPKHECGCLKVIIYHSRNETAFKSVRKM
jgi:hypothetical protein